MSDKKSFLDDINNTKLESFREEEFVKQKKNLLPAIILSATLLVIATVMIIIFTRGMVIPDMDGWKSNDVKIWADGNKAVVIYKEEYSVSADAGEVISTVPMEGTKLKWKDTVTVSVSKGADPNENIEFPDIKSMTLSEINAWVDENKLSGISIKKESSSVYEKNSVINYEVIDGTESDFIRKNRMNIYVSLGAKLLDDTVSVPDFSGNDKSQVVKWADDNGVTVEFTDEFNEYVDNGRVSKQGIDSNTKMNRTDVLKITMSLGKAITVPDFLGMKRSDAGETAGFKGIQLYYKNEISSQPEGTVLKQDIAAGTSIHDKQAVTLTLAAKNENVTMPDLNGMSSSDASTLTGIYGIRTFFLRKISSEPNGTVIGQSVAAGQEIGRDELVTIYVSSGNVMVPDFTIMTKSEAELWGQVNNTGITFIERYSDDYAAGMLYGQNFKNTLLLEGEMLIVYHSMGKVAVKDFTGLNKLDVIAWQREINSMGGDISLKFHIVTVAGAEPNRVTEQSVKGDFIPAQSRLDFWITADGKIIVPDMTAVSEEAFIQWCEKNSIRYSIEDRYSADYYSGVLYGQNFTGIRIPDGSKLVIYKSLGRPKVIDFAGYTKIKVEGWVNSINLLGANLSVEFSYMASDSITRDSVVSQNMINRWVPIGTELRVTLSSGPSE